MSYGFLTDFDPDWRKKQKNTESSRNGKGLQLKQKNYNDFRTVLTDDEDSSDSQVFNTAIQVKKDTQQNQIFCDPPTDTDSKKSVSDTDQTRCSLLENENRDTNSPIVISETSDSAKTKTTNRRSSAKSVFHDTNSDSNHVNNPIKKSSNANSCLADTIIGEISSIETQMSFLDIKTNNREEIIIKQNVELCDTVVGGTLSEFGMTSQESSSGNNEESIKESYDSNRNIDESVESIISVSSSTISEKQDSMEKEYLDGSYSDSQDDEEEEDVISVPDTDEEDNFNTFTDSKLPLRSDSFDNCSSIVPSSSQQTPSSTKLNEFFNNVPLINTPERYITHSIVKKTCPNTIDDNDEDEASITENRFQRLSIVNRDDDDDDDDERWGCVVDESDLSNDECPELPDVKTPEEKTDNVNNELIESEQQIVNSENTVSRSFSKSTKSSSGVCQINISAKIKINIQIADDLSTSSSSSDSNPTDNPSQEIVKSTENKSTPRNTPMNKNATPNASETGKNTPKSSVKVTKNVSVKKVTVNSRKKETPKSDIHKSKPETSKKNIPPKSKKKLNLETPKKPEDQKLGEVEASILQEIYGDAWKTPEVLKCFSKRVINQTKNSLGDNSFGTFESKVPDDMESTRLKKTHKKPETPRYLDICDPDTESEDESESEETSNESDESYVLSGSESNDSDIENNIKTKTEKTKRKTREKSPPVFHISDESSADEEEPFKLPINKKVLQEKTKRDIVKDYLELSDRKNKADKPKSNLKRKLFTHRHFDLGLEDENSNEKVDEDEKKSDDDNVNISPSIFRKPVNRLIDNVKNFHIGSTPNKQILAAPKNAKTPQVKPKKKIESPNVKSAAKCKTKENIQNAASNFGEFSFLKSLDVWVNKNYCHPEALIYRENFKSKKDELAKKLYDIFNEKVFDNKLNVGLTWNKKLTNTAGRCRNKRKMGERFSEIELSDKVLTSADRLRCTLIHEMCHAATWIFEADTGHGATWKAWAAKANQVFPELPKISTCHNYAIEYKYTYQCTLCKARHNTHSKSKKVEEIRCSICKGSIELFLNKKNKNGDIVQTPVREATGFAKFVQEKYKEFKKPDLKHAQVMKLLSLEFATLSVQKKQMY